MASPDESSRPAGEPAANDRPDGSPGDSTARDGTRPNPAPDAHDGERHPDTPRTMQHDHEDAPGRQRYADARPGDYSGDFQQDGSGAHPVKPLDEGATDDDGIPKVAAREPHEGKGEGKNDST